MRIGMQCIRIARNISSVIKCIQTPNVVWQTSIIWYWIVVNYYAQKYLNLGACGIYWYIKKLFKRKICDPVVIECQHHPTHFIFSLVFFVWLFHFFTRIQLNACCLNSTSSYFHMDEHLNMNSNTYCMSKTKKWNEMK